MRGPALKPLARLGVTLAIVWFYQGLTTAYLDGFVQVAVVVVLAIPTWIVVGRAVFPAGTDSFFRNDPGPPDPPDTDDGSERSGRK